MKRARELSVSKRLNKTELVLDDLTVQLRAWLQEMQDIRPGVLEFLESRKVVLTEFVRLCIHYMLEIVYALVCKSTGERPRKDAFATSNRRLVYSLKLRIKNLLSLIPVMGVALRPEFRGQLRRFSAARDVRMTSTASCSTEDSSTDTTSTTDEDGTRIPGISESLAEITR